MKTKLDIKLNKKSDWYHIGKLGAILLYNLSPKFLKKLCFTLN